MIKKEIKKQKHTFVKSKRFNRELILKKLSRLRSYEFAAIIAVISLIFFNIFSFVANCSNISNEVLRLHVIANSNSEKDQEVKLLVRDAVLEAGKEIFDGTTKAGDAAEKISPHIEKLKTAAKDVILANGCDYGAEIIIAEEYFDTRAYEGFTLPAGKYMAVKVKLGQSEGENWWCVMFPPLCLPAASEQEKSDDLHMIFSDDELKIVKGYQKYEYRFKFVEIYKKLASNITSRQRSK